jgi:hypothetical protein
MTHNHQRINAIYTSVRRIISQQQSTNSTNANPSTCSAELDSHADTCGVGNTTYVLEYSNRTVDVGAFSQHFQALEDIPIVKAAVAYDDPLTGETFILIIGQALYFGDKVQDIHLNSNQLCANGMIVDDIHLQVILFIFPKRRSAFPYHLMG